MPYVYFYLCLFLRNIFDVEYFNVFRFLRERAPLGIFCCLLLPNPCYVFIIQWSELFSRSTILNYASYFVKASVK